MRSDLKLRSSHEGKETPQLSELQINLGNTEDIQSGRDLESLYEI